MIMMIKKMMIRRRMVLVAVEDDVGVHVIASAMCYIAFNAVTEQDHRDAADYVRF